MRNLNGQKLLGVSTSGHLFCTDMRFDLNDLEMPTLEGRLGWMAGKEECEIIANKDLLDKSKNDEFYSNRDSKVKNETCTFNCIEIVDELT